MAKKSRKKTTFTLPEINVKDLLFTHYPSILTMKESSSEEEGEQQFEQTILNFDKDEEAKFSQILHEKSKRCEYFYDPHKAKNKVWITMYEFVNQGRQLPLYTKKPCWWCRHSFSSSPIGCPLEYCEGGKNIPKDYAKSMDISNENIDFFITEGIFCSYPCVLSYIHSQRMNSHYKRSTGLLALMYKKTHGKLVVIPRAQSFEIIDTYGGHLTINEFRSSFGRFLYEKSPNRRLPLMVPCGMMFQEKILKV